MTISGICDAQGLITLYPPSSPVYMIGFPSSYSHMDREERNACHRPSPEQSSEPSYNRGRYCRGSNNIVWDFVRQVLISNKQSPDPLRTSGQTTGDGDIMDNGESVLHGSISEPEICSIKPQVLKPPLTLYETVEASLYSLIVNTCIKGGSVRALPARFSWD